MCHMSVDNATRERFRAPLVRVCGAGGTQAFGREAARACATSYRICCLSQLLRGCKALRFRKEQVSNNL
jgi:hypothetical protein